MIRPATYDDVAELVAIAQECQRTMPWASHGLTMDMDGIIHTYLGLLEFPDADISVVDLGDGISGACSVMVQPYALNNGLLIASEWMWHMRPSFPDGLAKRKWIVRMLDHMLEFSREKGAHVFKANTVHADTALAALLERRGVAPMETVCIGRL